MKPLSKILVLWLLPTLAAAAPPTSPLEQARTLIDAGKADDAVALMQKNARADEKDPYRLYNLGLTLYQAGRYQEALQSFQAIDTTTHPELQQRATLQLGNVQYRLAEELKKTGQPVGAVASMERALDYYEAAHTLRSTRETKNNRSAARVHLEGYLLGVATSANRDAARQGEKKRYRDEERLLRNAQEAYQRAHEINPDNRETPPLIAEVTRRLVINLGEQGREFGERADAATKNETIKGRRREAIGKYEDALSLDPDNAPLTAARDEQLRKLSSLLTDEATTQAAEALAKTPEQFTPKNQTDLERAGTKLEEAISLDANNNRATALHREIQRKLEESYLYQGEKSLAVAQEDGTPHKRLEQARNAAAQFGKALAQNPENAKASEGLKKAEALLPELFGAAGEEDLAKAKGMQEGDAASPEALSNADLQKNTQLLDKAIANLDTAVALNPEATGYQKSLEEAQKLLDAANDEANRRSTAQQGEGRGSAPQQKGGPGQEQQGELREGKFLPLSLSDTSAEKPHLEENFWNRKIRDW